MRIKALPGRPAAAAITLLLIVASLALAACGSSSSTSSTTSSSAAQPAAGVGTGASGPQGPGGRFSALRTCLAKQGINLPPRRAGQRRPPTGPPGPQGGGVPGGGLPGGGFGGGQALPPGVTAPQFRAAIQKCGGAGRFGLRRLSIPAYRAALAKFAACMRQNGINLPAPNVTGNGPIFNTKGLNTTSASFKAANAKCQPNLRGSFGARAPGSAPGAAGA